MECYVFSDGVNVQEDCLCLHHGYRTYSTKSIWSLNLADWQAQVSNLKQQLSLLKECSSSGGVQRHSRETDLLDISAH